MGVFADSPCRLLARYSASLPFLIIKPEKESLKRGEGKRVAALSSNSPTLNEGQVTVTRSPSSLNNVKVTRTL